MAVEPDDPIRYIVHLTDREVCALVNGEVPQSVRDYLAESARIFNMSPAEFVTWTREQKRAKR